jgi:acyl-coenzyme A synthetase/AMP-(fatty) acid ligase
VRSLRVRRGLRQHSTSSSNIHRTETVETTAEGAEIIAPAAPETATRHRPEIGEAFPSDHPHYIIYTSGTTGAPKGNLLNIYLAPEELTTPRRGPSTGRSSRWPLLCYA